MLGVLLRVIVVRTLPVQEREAVARTWLELLVSCMAKYCYKLTNFIFKKGKFNKFGRQRKESILCFKFIREIAGKDLGDILLI